MLLDARNGMQVQVLAHPLAVLAVAWVRRQADRHWRPGGDDSFVGCEPDGASELCACVDRAYRLCV